MSPAASSSPKPLEYFLRPTEGDELFLRRFQRIADKIEADPSLLDIPLENIARWLAKGHASRTRLEGWRRMILDARASEGGMRDLLALLRAKTPEAMQWMGFSPFPGVLTTQELDAMQWTTRH